MGDGPSTHPVWITRGGVLIALLAVWACGSTTPGTASSRHTANVSRRTADLQQARFGHCAAALPDGRVLVAAGQSAAVSGPPTDASRERILDSVEVFDPTIETWTSAAPMRVRRMNCRALVLADGRVLVTGASGWDIGEIYDPATDAWTLASDPPEAYSSDQAAPLRDGRLLRVAATEGTGGAIAHVYDPRADVWSPVSTPSLRAVHALALLADGRVLAVGHRAVRGADRTDDVSVPAELYDAEQDAWTVTGSVRPGIRSYPLIPLPDGRAVLVVDTRRSQVFDPQTGHWTDAQASSIALLSGAGESTVTGLPDGRVLAIHGRATELFDVSSGSWTAGPSLVEGRSLHTATLLPDGEVLVVGGSPPRDPQGGDRQLRALASAERYAP